MAKTPHAGPQEQNPATPASQPRFAEGVALHRQGKLADARRIYSEVLQREPDHFDALHLLGVIAAQTQQTELGVELFKKAIGLNAEVADAHSNLGIALAHLKRPADALASYDRAIALKPDNAQVHYNRGIALRDLNRPDEALESYDAAIALKPDYADAYNNRGNVLREQKRPGEALASFDKAVTIRSDDADGYNNRGAVLLDLQRPQEALASFDQAIALKPDHADAYNNRGHALRQLQRPAEALASHDKAIALNSGAAGAYYNNRGIALMELKRPADALESYEKAIALKLDNAEVHYNRGNALRDLNRRDEALASYDKAIARRPNYADAHNNRGNVLQDLQRFEEALASYDKAVAVKPDFAEAHNNRGNPLLDLRRPEEALLSHDAAIALKPEYAEAHYNRGIALVELRRCEEALASYDKAIALEPDYTDAYWNQSLCFLLMGRFEQGWRQFEWRKKLKKPLGVRCYRQPLWLGAENIAGKTLFLYWEQGLGDTIQFCRYARLAELLGAKVVLSVQQPLRELLQQISPTLQIIGPLETPTDFDYHCPLMSLPLAFNTTISNVPANIPYLKIDPEKSFYWQEKLGGKNRLRVGLVWSGGFRPYQTESWTIRRNIPLSKLAVLKDPNIEFYTLQKGEPAESELAGLMRDNWDGPRIIDFTSRLHDFSDTAALVQNLNLVISVDTSTAHLAGALGKPVWILNRFDTCWRWLLERADSPWYPTVKLYRQDKPGHWDEVVSRIKMDLTSLRG
jgi:tetratricopeptide (TPR) repeat protein